MRIEGGVRIRGVHAVGVRRADDLPAGALTAADRAALAAIAEVGDAERTLVVATDRAGDFSPYTLRLVRSATQVEDPPEGFDEWLASESFNFRVDCPSDLDCAPAPAWPEPPPPAPRIDYLARDYAGVRRALLDRLAVTLPGWRERNPADLGVALVELLAHAGDQLSYFQDAVATEAYLGTARTRVSVSRHARLLGYAMHDGAAARVWCCFEVAARSTADGARLPAGTPVLSAELDAPDVLGRDEVADAAGRGAAVFETLHDQVLRAERNAIAFHTWGDPSCCLPRGATGAFLAGGAELRLQPGDALLIEDLSDDADPSRRHAVRLTEVGDPEADPLAGGTCVEVAWHDADALPFALPLELAEGPGRVRTLAHARANVVLADHGRSLDDAEPLGAPREGRRFRPALAAPDVTQAVPYDHAAARALPAADAIAVDPRRALAAVTVTGDDAPWTPRGDLLNSDRFSPHFVVEVDDEGTARLRFGDGVRGRASVGGPFSAAYRVGTGGAGNVGAGALRRFAVPTGTEEQWTHAHVVNPLPATGGTDPEPAEQVKLYAPHAFRAKRHAVTEADWVQAAMGHDEVQRAVATRRWTGSWITVFVAVDRRGGGPLDAAFERRLRAHLEPYRLAGQDLEIEEPQLVGLDIAFDVTAAPGNRASDVERGLLEAFSARDTPAGRGFFHPDALSFGEPLYLSRLVAQAMKVPGVASVAPTRFRRMGEPDHGELAAGRLTLSRLEIARADNDPSQPEHGRVAFDVQETA